MLVGLYVYCVPLVWLVQNLKFLGSFGTRKPLYKSYDIVVKNNMYITRIIDVYFVVGYIMYVSVFSYIVILRRQIENGRKGATIAARQSGMAKRPIHIVRIVNGTRSPRRPERDPKHVICAYLRRTSCRRSLYIFLNSSERVHVNIYNLSFSI